MPLDYSEVYNFPLGEQRRGGLVLPPYLMGGGSGAFDPLTLSPALWLKADAGLYQTAGGSAATSDGDPVGQWQDQSGNARHFAQATGGWRPTLKLNIKNGLPVIRTDGVDDVLASSAFQTFPSKRGSLYMVYRNTDAVYGAIASTFPDAAVDWEWFGATSGTKFKWYDGASATFTAANFDSGWMVAGIVRDGDTSMKHYVNGALADTFAVANNQPTSAVVALFGMAAGGENLAADVGEVLFFDTALTSDERTNLEAYLNGRWGAY